MLSALYAQTEAWQVDPHQSADSNSDVGSFDNTPAPSNRSSISATRPVLEARSYDRLPNHANESFRRRGHRPSMFAKLTRVHGDDEKEPLILLHDKADRDFIPLRTSSTGFKSNIVADGAKKENPHRLDTTPQNKPSSKKRLKIGTYSAIPSISLY